ncbi:uncharacterized protein SPAPADRAFT_56842 [Spathaspora passalidarum NRRL Y-27907]|uniref:Uncharacterized protein n=1 Tax=Spathaspora passalidarum (strain NRRL Y-27907 / 11-Y1) TaxID=619300 RepID=G3ATC9_SPAPN|nr:uncharacterized protein SPAPADRAFT_56842 [Spathaspora passalidarum NRRL Y-27907]EGW30892.1 hypothetical protein SPAPADRAFT_56842 [Spathaspora passalidarum NRRL Y-27907]
MSLVSLPKGNQWYPLNSKGEIPTDFKPYSTGQDVQFDCIQRNIDTGEHKFDDKHQIVYGPFPKCKETQKPLSFKYGINEDLNCTIQFSDELYHLFQLYIHQDVPFSCRMALSSEPLSIEKGGAYVPFTFNFRGEIHDAHLDIDPSMNIIFTKPSTKEPEQNTFVSAIGFGSGTNTTRTVIGDELTLNLAVRWFDQLSQAYSKGTPDSNLPYSDGFYRLPMTSIPISYSIVYTYVFAASAIASAVIFMITYGWVMHKVKKNRYMHLDGDIGKQD